jgi:hypothetical protein
MALAFIFPAVAGASRVAPPSLARAIVRAASGHLPAGIPPRCLLVRVTTKDGGAWATVGFGGVSNPLCARYGFNGATIVHRIRLGWHYVTEGSVMIPCSKLGIPLAVQRDLRLPCR